MELEDLRRQAYAGLQSVYRYTGRGYCPVCDIRTFFRFPYDVLPSRLGPALALPGQTVHIVVQKHWISIRCRSRSQHGQLHVISGNGH